MKYSFLLYREIFYLLFIFLAIIVLRAYLKNGRTLYGCVFFLLLLVGSMSKDFFNFCIPALVFVLLMEADFKIKKIQSSLKLFLRWQVVLCAFLYVVVTCAYYMAKLATSQKEKGLLFGGFNPAHSIYYYGKYLWTDAPMLLLGLIAGLLVAYTMFSWKTKQTRSDLTYFAVLASFLAILLSVHTKHPRYIFIFYPMAAIFAGRAIAAITRKDVRIAVSVLALIACVISSSVSYAADKAEVSEAFALQDDHEPISYLKENNISGNILVLSAYRFDQSYYTRLEEYNLDHIMIVAYFEKRNAQLIPWSRFRMFNEMHDQCKQKFTLSCWDAFVKQYNISLIFVEKKPLLETGSEEFAEKLALQAPLYETPAFLIYSVS
jgi:hypothetical protein